MRRVRRTGVLALAASLALTAGAVTASLPAAALTAEYVDAGALSLTVASGLVTFTEPTGTGPAATQSLGTPGSGCIVPASGDLLAFAGSVGTATGKTVGWKGSTIGVNEKVSSLCNLVDTVSQSGAETLELKLAPGLVNFANRPLLASSASLNLAMGVKTIFTFNKAATVEATAYRTTAEGTVRVGGTVTVKNGSEGCSSTFGATCALNIVAPTGEHFDSVRLKALGGAFGLQTALVNLKSEVDAIVQCVPGSSVTEGTTTVTYQGGGTCTEVGIVIKNQAQEVTFLKPSNDPNAKFVLDVKWTIPVPSGIDPIPNTTVNFVTTDHQIGWCQGAVIVGGNLTDATVGADLEPDDVLTGVQYACVGKQSADIVDGGNKLEVKEQIFLVGDVALRK